jgi:hypothetical protein
MPDDWFRATSWSEEIAERFEERLRRARRSSRPQYVRIQGVTLIDAGHEDEGRILLRRVVDDYAEDSFQSAWAMEGLGQSYQRTGDNVTAEHYYRAVMTHPDSAVRDGGSGVVALGLAEVLADDGNRQQLLEAERLLSDPGLHDRLFFDVQRFRHAVASAQVADRLGKRDDAARFARLALHVASDSRLRDQLPRHPGVGKAAPESDLLTELRRLAG